MPGAAVADMPPHKVSRNLPRAGQLARMHPIESRIRICNGHATIPAADLATLYGASTRTLMECIQKHAPAPGEYVFLPDEEIVASDRDARHADGGYVFTEHGAIAAAYTLGTEDALRESIQVLRAFVRFRKALAPREERPPF